MTDQPPSGLSRKKQAEARTISTLERDGARRHYWPPRVSRCDEGPLRSVATVCNTFAQVSKIVVSRIRHDDVRFPVHENSLVTRAHDGPFLVWHSLNLLDLRTLHQSSGGAGAGSGTTNVGSRLSPGVSTKFSLGFAGMLIEIPTSFGLPPFATVSLLSDRFSCSGMWDIGATTGMCVDLWDSSDPRFASWEWMIHSYSTLIQKNKSVAPMLVTSMVSVSQFGFGRG